MQYVQTLSISISVPIWLQLHDSQSGMNRNLSNLICKYYLHDPQFRVKRTLSNLVCKSYLGLVSVSTARCKRCRVFECIRWGLQRHVLLEFGPSNQLKRGIKKGSHISPPKLVETHEIAENGKVACWRSRRAFCNKSCSNSRVSTSLGGEMWLPYSFVPLITF